MLDILRTHDSEMVELPSEHGSVLIPPRLNGRIFCQLHGELIHRLDTNALLNPSLVDYNNLGGNSLWPAPEGGDFAFNYLPASNAWVVQAGIANAIPSLRFDENGDLVVEKTITLTNRRGVEVGLVYRRIVSVLPATSWWSDYRVNGLAYATTDIWEPTGVYFPEDVLIAPWSLEQFPGAEEIVAFGKYERAADALNFDFYGDPGERITHQDQQFIFRLGGVDRHQIGIRAGSRPQLIGALDPSRSMLFIRKTAVQDGTYFNIADNDQASGPFSTADVYSIFNGGELGFFELETIGSMQVEGGVVSTGTLTSQTIILQGEATALRRLLAEQYGVRL